MTADSLAPPVTRPSVALLLAVQGKCFIFLRFDYLHCLCQEMLKMPACLFYHSVESPSMVDPQWNIWYWRSKGNLHTVCWSADGCEWGTTSVYFGITYVCFIPSRLPVFAVEPQYLLHYFLFLPKVSFELHIQNLQKTSCWFKIWMGFVGPILIKLWTCSIWGFHAGDHSVTTEACRPPHLTCLGLCSMAALKA